MVVREHACSLSVTKLNLLRSGTDNGVLSALAECFRDQEGGRSGQATSRGGFMVLLTFENLSNKVPHGRRPVSMTTTGEG